MLVSREGYLPSTGLKKKHHITQHLSKTPSDFTSHANRSCVRDCPFWLFRPPRCDRTSSRRRCWPCTDIVAPEGRWWWVPGPSNGRLVGGFFNPSEKYAKVKMGILGGLKPPPSKAASITKAILWTTNNMMCTVCIFSARVFPLQKRTSSMLFVLRCAHATEPNHCMFPESWFKHHTEFGIIWVSSLHIHPNIASIRNLFACDSTPCERASSTHLKWCETSLSPLKH